MYIVNVYSLLLNAANIFFYLRLCGLYRKLHDKSFRLFENLFSIDQSDVGAPFRLELVELKTNFESILPYRTSIFESIRCIQTLFVYFARIFSNLMIRYDENGNCFSFNNVFVRCPQNYFVFIC